MEGIGFEWAPGQASLENIFDDHIEQLKLFKEEEGHLQLPNSHKLYKWTKFQLNKVKYFRFFWIFD